MKAVCNRGVAIVLSALCLGVSVSCDRDVELVDKEHSTLATYCGGNFEIPVLADNWTIEYVKDAVSGLNMSDKDGNRLTLEGDGTIEASDGWLTLSRQGTKAFVVNLKENFDQSRERKISICINNGGKRDYVNIVQRAGTEYRLVDWEYEEIEGEREIYTSDEDCTNVVLSNTSGEEVWLPSDGIFEDVVETSLFESDDYGAFDWMPQEGVEVFVPDLIIDGVINGGNSNRYPYKDEVTAEPLNASRSSTILMRPYSITYLSGEITYCKRVCNYTFTIQNQVTGTRFEVNGVWTQIVPISSTTIISDKP